MLAAEALARVALAALERVVLLIALVATVVTEQRLVLSVQVRAAVLRWAALRVVVVVDEIHCQLAAVVLQVTQLPRRVAGTGTLVR